jgi:hypothetical protein
MVRAYDAAVRFAKDNGIEDIVYCDPGDPSAGDESPRWYMPPWMNELFNAVGMPLTHYKDAPCRREVHRLTWGALTPIAGELATIWRLNGSEKMIDAAKARLEKVTEEL